MDRETFRKAGYAAIDRVCDYFENIESYSVLPDVQPGDISALIGDTAPEEGEEWGDIAKDFDRVVLPGITHWQHPNFYAFFPANVTYECILADIYANAVQNPGFNWIASPACTEMESSVLDWMARLFGLDPSFYNASKVGGGIIMGTASESALTVCIAARERVFRMLPGTPLEKLIIYVSSQTHSLGAKAAQLLGFECVTIHTSAENDWALTGQELQAQLEKDASRGKIPFMLYCTVGTTSTGAIDHIAEVKQVAKSHPQLFIHVDAAWGGVYLACPEFRDECCLKEINSRSEAEAFAEGEICKGGEVHSFCTNLHKIGLTNLDASLLWVRDRKLLTEAMDITPPFLRNAHSDQGKVVDYRNWQLALGRRFRSLKIYFVMKSYGVAGFQKNLRRINGLTQLLEALVLSAPDRFALFVPRRFSLLVFHLKVPEDILATLDSEAKKIEVQETLNKGFYGKLEKRNDVYLTLTNVNGTSCIRVAVGSPYTEEKHIRQLWDIIQKEADSAQEDLRLRTK